MTQLQATGINAKLFGIFFRIGIGTIGGGYAMIPLMEHELVERQEWLSREDFLDILAVAQSSPGVFAVNMSSHIGYKLGGVRSSLVATLASVLPSFLIILLIAMGASLMSDNRWVEGALKAIRPVVVALIAAPVFSLARSAGLGWRTLWIPVLAVVFIWLLGVSPIYVIVGAIAMGYIYGTVSMAKRSTNKGG